MWERLWARLRSMGWRALPWGALMVVVSGTGLWCLFALKSFSSQVRDQFENPPSTGSYLALYLSAALFVSSAVLGSCLIYWGVSAVLRRPGEGGQ